MIDKLKTFQDVLYFILKEEGIVKKGRIVEEINNFKEKMSIYLQVDGLEFELTKEINEKFKKEKETFIIYKYRDVYQNDNVNFHLLLLNSKENSFIDYHFSSLDLEGDYIKYFNIDKDVYKKQGTTYEKKYEIIKENYKNLDKVEKKLIKFLFEEFLQETNQTRINMAFLNNKTINEILKN